jgi:hypothetical protein
VCFQIIICQGMSHKTMGSLKRVQVQNKNSVIIPNKEQITRIIEETTSEGSQQILASQPPHWYTHDNQLQLTAQTSKGTKQSNKTGRIDRRSMPPYPCKPKDPVSCPQKQRGSSLKAITSLHRRL